ncbi:MAG: hypothetical protein Q4F24_15385 [Eubacteriales bacterium]|nr:hypothetical protein [Eubacteriales bacterium]
MNIVVNPGKMIDFHSHILPGIDDGSKNIEESLAMLEMSANQGITGIALTPHFYADKDTPEQFLKRRNAAMEQLLAVRQPHYPKMFAGAEVRYFPGMQRTEEILQLRLEETPYLLVEMPFTLWTSRMADEILELNQKKDIQVVLAHIDRYLSMQKPKTIEMIWKCGVLLQANADSFLTWRECWRMLRLMKQGRISFLGSDCHNLTTRPPCLAQALEVIVKRLGPQVIETMKTENEQVLWGGELIR